MRSKIVIFLVCCLCTFTALAQSDYAVKGIVSDTTTNVKMDQATISVLDARDSILQKFTYADKGTFNIRNLKPGKFLIMVNYPDYADFVESFTLDASKPVYNFGNIKMILKSKLLDEVIIKAKVVAIKIKGDTTEFNAAAYATQKNAKVEDLLKQLQGMKINQSGVIIFQGEPVSKILVDGEEFFSDDPGLVAKTVRADMVSKVQVYDQKSEKAKLTGIEDGVKVKTINIVLREDKKKGIFGKVDAAYGTDDYYAEQLMFNKFSPKQKTSAYGNIGNTGKVGLSSNDNSKFNMGYGNGDYGGVGIPFARDAGAHYDSKWNRDKQSVNVNYKIGALNKDGTRSTLTQNNLPGNFNRSSQDRTFQNYNFNQSVNGEFSSKLDSTSNLSTYFYGNKDNSTSENTSIGSTIRGNGVLQNSSTVSSNDRGNNESVYARAYYTKRLKKKGRNLSVSMSTRFGETSNKGYLKSDLNYYNEQGVRDSTSIIDQYKPVASKTNSLSTSFSYSDVISKTISVTTGYSFDRAVNNNSQKSFNKSSSNVYDQLDSTFSSEFRLINQSSTYSVNMNYFKGKTSVNIGANLADVKFKQTDMFVDTVLNRKFLNWRPNANLSYQLSKATSMSFEYSGNTWQPQISQLQPIRQNSDPLNIILGNPELRPQFENNFYYRYRVYQATLDQGINFRVNYNSTMNAIVTNRVTDSAGVNTMRYSNLKGKNPNSWYIYSEVYGHATKLDFIAFISFTVRGDTYFNYVNNQLNKTKSVNYAPQLDITKNTANYSYSLSIAPSYNVNSSSLQHINNNSKGFLSSFSFYTKLPYNFFIGSDITYKYRAKNEVFTQDFNQTLLNSHVGKLFLKNESLKLTIRGNDLLNQNTGV